MVTHSSAQLFFITAVHIKEVIVSTFLLLFRLERQVTQRNV
ncbi:hypothetical protein RV11_GL002341 [Enterococcus phoeniculicola]|nr:hypothetical protein RV11_GL002341 [Enterococcus phoeniculicola]